MALAGCGDDGGDNAAAQPSKTDAKPAANDKPASSTDDLALAKRILLSAADLPSGFTKDDTPVKTAAELEKKSKEFAACQGPEPEAVEEQATAWAESPTFNNDEALSSVSSVAVVHATKAAAEQVIGLIGTDKYKACAVEKGKEEEVQNDDTPTIEDISFAQTKPSLTPVLLDAAILPICAGREHDGLAQPS